MKTSKKYLTRILTALCMLAVVAAMCAAPLSVSAAETGDLRETIVSNENYETISAMELTSDGWYDSFVVGTDDGNYLYTTTAGGVNSPYHGTLPVETGFVWEYKVFIPEGIENYYYVYPCFQDLDVSSLGDYIECTIEISPNGIRPYLKNQQKGNMWTTDDYGFGVDTSWSGGVAKAGDWNTIEMAVLDQQAAVYINGQLILQVTIPTLGFPSGMYIGIWPGAGDVAPFKLKDFKFSGIRTPAPSVESVSISASKVNAKVGETVNITASLTPFNATAENIAWYVNDKQVEGAEMTYSFTAQTAGSYKIHCVIDGVVSSQKTITVAEEPSVEDTKPNSNTNPAEPNNTLVPVIVAGVVVLAVIVVICVAVKARKKKA